MTILNLWATWCPPCVKEIPYFVEFYKRHHKKNIKIILLSIEGKESEETILKPFLTKNPIPFQVYLLEKGTPEELEKILKTELSGALPITLIYDKEGKIIKKVDGPISLEELEIATNTNSKS
ncbi:MAG: TlpA family protein disulfide reductase [Candidatus Hydrogenedentes bacterium]|nr:TlpA family protein disulfide reductase [Candidatus Hydrogenedentota bacterium]